MKEYHCADIRLMKLSKICPSLALGFYVRDAGEFAVFKANIERVGKMENSFFSVFQKRQDSSQFALED